MAKTGSAPPAAWKAWLMAAWVFAGFVIGGIALIVDEWWLFWVGWGFVGTGVIYGWFIRVMEYTEEYAVDGERVEPGTTARHG